MPVGACERIVAEHGPQDGEMVYELAFDRDEQGTRRVSGSVFAHVRMICSRCLAPVELTLRPRFVLGIVADDAAAAALPEPYDPLVSAAPMPLAQLLEDELLLALPLVPVHLDGGCGRSGDLATTPVDGTARQGPFAILAQWRGPDGRDD